MFLIYINDLRFCLNKCKANHFADDTCITFAHKNKNILEATVNDDLLSVSEWLKANRLMLNVSKTKLLIFHSKRRNVIHHDFVIKLEGNTLQPDSNVKYLGMLIDNNLSWSCHIRKLCTSLSRANGILSKLRHLVPFRVLKSIYYAVFHSKLLYGCLGWSLSTLINMQSITVLQKCLRIMNFKPFNCHTNELFASNEITKLDDLVKIEQINLAYQFNYKSLPTDIMDLFQLNVNRYSTRNMADGGILVPPIKTLSYGERSIRYAIQTIWNKFIKNNDHNRFKSPKHLRNFLKSSYIDSYIKS